MDKRNFNAALDWFYRKKKNGKKKIKNKKKVSEKLKNETRTS